MAVKAKSRAKKNLKKTSTTKEFSESLVPEEQRVDMNAEVSEYAESLILPEERMSMIAEAAYYRAEQRGFAHGGHEHDWLEAEKVVDEMLIDAAKKANY